MDLGKYKTCEWTLGPQVGLISRVEDTAIKSPSRRFLRYFQSQEVSEDFQSFELLVETLWTKEGEETGPYFLSRIFYKNSISLAHIYQFSGLFSWL